MKSCQLFHDVDLPAPRRITPATALLRSMESVGAGRGASKRGSGSGRHISVCSVRAMISSCSASERSQK